ncbi:DUF6252 domain-containing protein [Flavobacterium antarcticum]|uniref:DUF6252 family protein n=1 Tax=Flavobacterium antarcticum TaxID=271155 RepID=UPI0003B5FF06|nr:DUF6252 family protein [Flavobacterium antarcticum]
MKKINRFLLLFLVTTATIFTSCSTDVEPLDPSVLIPDSSTNGQLKVDFDGQTFVATNIQAVVNSTAISITGLRSGNNDFLQITLPAPLNQVGTYTWTNATASNAILGLMYSNSASEGFVSAPANGDFVDFPAYTDTAKVTVTSIDEANKTISGTFEFTGGRFDDAGNLVMKKFTNGSFTNIKFSGDVVTPSGNTFFAKVDGVAFEPTSVNSNVLSGSIFVSGKKAGVENITLTVPSTITPGTYEFSTFGTYIGMYIVDTTQNGTFNADSGSFTITTHDTSAKKIKGTFNFVGKSLFSTATHTITEGAFDVTYQ